MYLLEIIMFISVLLALMWILNFTLKKIFKIEKEKRSVFSNNHVNDLHKKVDGYLRWVSLLATLIVLYYFIFIEISIIYYITTIGLFIFLDYVIKAFFEIIYSQNPKQSILTLSELALLALIFAVVVQFDVFGLLV